MAKRETVTITNMCMICDRDKILVQERNKKTWPGLTFPGGHVEINESIVESTIREVKEETGLTVRNLKLCGIAHWTPLLGGRYLVFCYKTDDFSGDLRDSSEGRVFWIPKKDLKKYHLSQDLEEIFTVMDSSELSEFYSLREDDDHEILRKLI